jgi:hypothetical protein
MTPQSLRAAADERPGASGKVIEILSGYHPTWPAWLRSVAWWIRNPFPGLTEFWLGLKKPIQVYEQIDGHWFLRKARLAEQWH